MDIRANIPVAAGRDLYVKDIIKEVENNELVNPFFQREFVWPEKKQRDFIQYTIDIQQLEAPVHTYCLPGSYIQYLKDGRQRLTTLGVAIAAPHVFDLTKEHVDLLRHISVHIMHRQHDTHETAMVSFQNLNKGTGLLPYDLWRGEIAGLKIGNIKLGEHLYDRVRLIVNNLTAGLAGQDVIKADDMKHSVGSGGRKRNGQLHRGALALFHMWATKNPVVETILTHDTYTKTVQPEFLVAELIKAEGWDLVAADREIQKFYDYLHDVVTLIERLVIERNSSFAHTHKRWEVQTVRAIFNAAVFVRLRQDIPATALAQFINWYFDHGDGLDEWKSRFFVDSKSLPGVKEEVRMSQHNLYWLREAADEFGFDITRKRAKKKTKTQGVRGKKGCHRSHIVSAANGGCETVVEDALTNLSRGADNMTTEELVRLTNSPEQATFSFNKEAGN
jgi:hypothetical protein